MTKHSAIPNYRIVLKGGELYGAYLNHADASLVLARLKKRGIMAKIVEGLRVW